MDVSRTVNLHAWEAVKEKITSGTYDVIVLDEFTFLMHFGWLDTQEVVNWILKNKPQDLHLIITGRYAPSELLAAANLVTEMLEIKHHYKQHGLTSQPGVNR